MNAFVPQNPRVVLAVDTNGKLRSFNNIDPAFKVEICMMEDIEQVAAGLPYDSANPRPQTQVLAMKKSK